MKESRICIDNLSSRDWQVLIDQDKVTLSATHQAFKLKSAISVILDDTSSEDPTVLTVRAIALMKYLSPFMEEITTREKYDRHKLAVALDNLPNNPLLRTVAKRTADFINASGHSHVDISSRQVMVGSFVDEAVAFIEVK